MIVARPRPALAGALLAATALAPAAFAQTPRDAATRDGTVSKAEVSSGSLLLQSVHARPLCRGAACRRRREDGHRRPGDPHPTHPALHQPDRQMGRRRLRLPAARRRRRRHAEDRHRRPLHRRRHQGAQGSPHHLRDAPPASGQRAGLVEEERPNLFTTSLANIGPGETVAIQIEFQDKARLDNGVWSTRFPLVIAPRYIPKAARRLSSPTPPAASASAIPAFPTRDRITPPVLHPAT